MSIALANLADRLSLVITGLSASQYEDAIRSAVATLGNMAGRKKLAEIATTSGTASYDLPADFLKVIRVEPLGIGYADVAISGSGVIPLGHMGVSERYTIAGRRLTWFPAPSYTTTRYIWYKAGFALDENEVYSDMTEEEAELVMVKAQANALRVAAAGKAEDGWKYSIGDVSIDKSTLGQKIIEQSRGLDAEFEMLVKQYTGAAGTPSIYP